MGVRQVLPMTDAPSPATKGAEPLLAFYGELACRFVTTLRTDPRFQSVAIFVDVALWWAGVSVLVDVLAGKSSSDVFRTKAVSLQGCSRWRGSHGG
jgi:hypothetical protein